MKPEEAAWLCEYALRAMTGQPHGKFWLAADALESGDLRIVAVLDHFVESLEGGDTRSNRTWRQECESLLPRLAALESENAHLLKAIEYLTGEPPVIGIDSGRGVSDNDRIQMSGRVGMAYVSGARLAALEKVAEQARGWMPHNHGVGRGITCEEVQCPRATLAELDALEETR